jgi:tripartite-type tricarboxylate transporter receptor subunit TctC
MLRLFVALALCVALSASPASAQGDYPSKVIRMIVGFAAGGGNDIFARIIAQKLSERTGWTVVIENKPGAGGNIAAEFVAKAPKDGYTLLWGLSTQLTVNPTLYTNTGFDVEKDFAPISTIAESALVLAVNPKVPANSVPELIKYMKANPGKLNATTAGVGSPPYLANMLFMSRTGTDFVNVQYKGSTALPVRTGEADLLFGGVGGVQGFIKEGTLRPLAVTSPERLPTMPELPTVKETGVPNYEVMVWHSLVAPAGTPQPVLDALYKGLTDALASPELKDFLAARAVKVTASTPDQLRKRMRDETGMWQKILKDANVGQLN